MRWTRAEYEQHPKRASLSPDCAGIRAVQSKPVKRLPLDNIDARKKESWYDAAGSLEIVFIVHSVRPCDWDGYDIKALQDFLITAGIIPDDGWKTLSGRVVSRKAATKADEKTEIILSQKPLWEEK